jgi:hypothetical protein
MTPKPTSVISSSKAAPNTMRAIRAPRIPNPPVRFSMHVGTVLEYLTRKLRKKHNVEDGIEVDVIRRVRRADA